MYFLFLILCYVQLVYVCVSQSQIQTCLALRNMHRSSESISFARAGSRHTSCSLQRFFKTTCLGQHVITLEKLFLQHFKTTVINPKLLFRPVSKFTWHPQEALASWNPAQHAQKGQSPAHQNPGGCRIPESSKNLAQEALGGQNPC